MKDNDTYDYNSTFTNPNANIPIDILNNVPIWYSNNTYNFYWNVIEVIEVNIIY